MSINTKKIITIALAYVGVIVGAGFASGKELEQYYVSFGAEGIYGLILSLILYSVTGLIILELGNYYQAKNHRILFQKITHPFLAKLLDLLINLTLFTIGLTMIAGGGSNLNQQFGFPTWMGALIIAVTIVLVSFFDVKKITETIGFLTPLIVIFFMIIPIYAILTRDLSLTTVFSMAEELPTTLPNWSVSSLNHVAMNYTTVVSMGVVMGAYEPDRSVAGKGGAWGGAFVGVLQILAYISILLKVDVAGGQPMPMLALVDSIHPLLGSLMSLVIFLMIFSTGVGMFYPLTIRVTENQDEKTFMKRLTTMVTIGFALSFVGFEQLVAYVFPIIGYGGFLLIAVLLIAWMRMHRQIKTNNN